MGIWIIIGDIKSLVMVGKKKIETCKVGFLGWISESSVHEKKLLTCV